MQLLRIDAKNFRGIEHASVDLSGHRAAFITGLNAQGKTSLLDAVRLVLLGQVNDPNGKAYKLGALVPDSSRVSIVMVRVSAGEQSFDLVWKREGSKTSFSIVDAASSKPLGGNADAQRRELFRVAGLDYDKAVIAANAQALLFSRDIVPHLQAFSGGDVDPEKVFEYAEAQGFADALRECTGDLSTLTSLRALGETAEAKRLECNREIRHLTELLNEPLVAVSESAMKLIESCDGSIEEHLKRLETEVEATQDKLSHALDADTRRRYEVVLEEYTGEDGDLERHEAEYREIVAAEAEAQKTVDDYKRAIEEVRSGATETNDEHVTVLRQRLTCLQSGKCECTGVEFGGAKKTREAVDAAAVRLQDEIDALTVDPEEVKRVAAEKIKELEAKVANALNLAQERQRTAKSLRNTITEKVQLVNEARSKLNMDTGNPEEIKANIESLRSQVIDSSAAVDALRAADLRTSQGKDLADAKVKRKALDAMVRAFRDGEYFATLEEETSGLFDAINERLKPQGMTLGCAFEGKDATITIAGPRHDALPAVQCSKGERFFAAMAIAMHFGQGAIALIDDADDLDAVNKAVLRGLLQDDTAFGFGTLLVSGAWGMPGALEESLHSLTEAFAPAAVIGVMSGSAKVVAAKKVEAAA